MKNYCPIHRKKMCSLYCSIFHGYIYNGDNNVLMNANVNMSLKDLYGDLPYRSVNLLFQQDQRRMVFFESDVESIKGEFHFVKKCTGHGKITSVSSMSPCIFLLCYDCKQ